ncbi:MULTISPECIES: HAD family hydrolase [unclassified Mesorhizobium]|uniref:HAD family hydrolase n=1 Tax=unclassified Mesorhizobium TaxID=325217 RepID=UPI000FD33A6C|nr:MULTISPECIES: HAD family hydrolase [unclassified Mesorhizobium]RUV27125.1 HAD family hydrolase [Mesorhizobium sp. M5C.F.Ca.IN.020.32.2.1]RWD53681.1 MAG: HAD family hydrolase [Mesorhizobium sp.]RWG48354.1 MAG: HAD family hydrolase [Mesorhizobium sp.]RWH51647.1 MAG: HAD family hydrolase [Mesorhizobium sp.]RWI04934.1 MAG: HAD family hydrolase [Mesorhizobium sp.]
MNQQPSYELVIFDCDGVLIDSETLASRIDAEELTRIGYPMSYSDVILRFTGLSSATMRKMIEEDWGRPLPSDFDVIVQSRIKESYQTELQAISGIDQLLHQLRLPRCVASSSAPDKLRLGLELTELWAYFHPHVFSSAMVKAGKPAPDLFLFAAAQMGTKAARCVVVEDSIAGVRAGVAAGMMVIGFTAGGHCHDDHGQRLLSAGAAVVARSAEELSVLLMTSEVQPNTKWQEADPVAAGAVR